MQTPDNRLVEYVHAPTGQRIAKKVDGAVVEKYLWLDLTTLLAVYDGQDNLLQRFEYAGTRTPTRMRQGGQTYYIVSDNLGTPKAVTDASGNVVKALEYDSFGNVVADSNPGFRLPFGFAGGLYDADAGLIRFGYRDYDPEQGRWTARDPIGFNGGDTNLYSYVRANPVMFTDPTGPYWFRQPGQQPGVVGRPGTPVQPGGKVRNFIETNVPAGYTFGQLHDSIVGSATEAGLPDWAVNLQSMLPSYWLAQYLVILRALGLVPQPEPPKSCD